MKDFLQSSAISKIILLLLVILAILVIFQAGVVVGYRRGVFSYYWNSHYYQGISDPGSVFATFIRHGDDINPHGAVGEIVTAELPIVMIKGPDFSEQMVMVSPTTTIRRMRAAAVPEDLRTGDHVIVVGEPGGQGQIYASFIRVLPFEARPAPATSTLLKN
ncbi:MAG: hypothetical protein QOG91_427 [Candidatus Parcubacteria bacterium]|jgi:hypothetical protein|nr:hypothetical protein [Candidatus Parcubacteria bacterium]